MTQRKVFCVATGMHRSGTTWLGKAIGSLPGVFSMEEPFNHDYGLAGVPRWYVDFRDPQDVAYTRSALGAIEAGRVRYRRKLELHRPLASIGRRLIGNGSERSYRAFLRTGGTLINLKDSSLLMMIPELVNLGIKVVVSVRHPAPIHTSLGRMGWHIPNEHLAGRDPGGDVSVVRDGATVAMAMFWKGVYQPLIDQLRTRGGDGILVAFHETMFDDVDRLGRALLRFLDRTDPADAAGLMGFVRASTSSTTVQPGHARQHELSRDSRKLAQSWRTRLSDADRATYDRLVGADYEFLLAASTEMLDSLAPR